MGDDAEWVGVDFEFGKDKPTVTTTTTRRPRPQYTERPSVGRPHDAPEIAPPSGRGHAGSLTTISAAAGGVLGVVLLSLLVYMLVLRKRLNKAKVASTNSQYQLRVEDVAHITNLDETSNTYVNTNDLQKLLSSVRAKKKSEERLPTLPKLQHETPTPYRSNKGSSGQSHGNSAPDVVVVRAPMPIPHNKTDLHHDGEVGYPTIPVQDTEALYSNIEPMEPFKLAQPTPRKKAVAPTAAPPPPPKKQEKSSVNDHIIHEAPASPTVIARPAPPPPALKKTKSTELIDTTNIQAAVVNSASKPTPPVAPKPNKSNQTFAITVPAIKKPALPPSTNMKPSPPSTNVKPTPILPSKPVPPSVPKPTQSSINKPTPPSSKPAPPVASKPGLTKKGKGLPPLKMALLPSHSKSSIDSCDTPDTGIIELTPDSTPEPENTGTPRSVTSKIAFLEGKMKTPILPNRALHHNT